MYGTADDRCYLDLVAGIAVCALGHAHPAVVAAVKEQAENLFHVSNLYHIAPQILLARLLVENSPFDKAFFCNSGAEANEAAIKLARKYASEQMKGRYETHHDAGLLPWPDPGHRDGNGTAEISCRLRAASRRDSGMCLTTTLPRWRRP